MWSYVSRTFYAIPLLYAHFLRSEDQTNSLCSGSFHGNDILSTFGLLPTDPTKELQSRWIAFANTLNPNTGGYTYWPRCTFPSPLLRRWADPRFADGTNATLLQFTELGSGRIYDTFRAAPIACELLSLSLLVVGELIQCSGRYFEYRQLARSAPVSCRSLYFGTTPPCGV